MTKDEGVRLIPADYKKGKVKKNKITVSWKNIKKTEKIYKQIKAVEVQYSTDKKFKKNVKN